MLMQIFRKYLLLLTLSFIFLSCNSAANQDSSGFSAAESKTIINVLQATTTDWNKGNLPGFVSLYDSSATFMTRKGLIGLATLTQHYQKTYFNNQKPKQLLQFEALRVRPLGVAHALVTGKFILSGGNLPEQSGRFSLVFARTAQGWKILHDHSS